MVHDHPLAVVYLVMFIMSLLNLATKAGQDAFAKAPGSTLVGYMIGSGITTGLVGLVFMAAGRL